MKHFRALVLIEKPGKDSRRINSCVGAPNVKKILEALEIAIGEDWDNVTHFEISDVTDFINQKKEKEKSHVQK